MSWITMKFGIFEFVPYTNIVRGKKYVMTTTLLDLVNMSIKVFKCSTTTHIMTKLNCHCNG